MLSPILPCRRHVRHLVQNERMRALLLSGACLLAAGGIVAAPLEQAAMRIAKDSQGYWFYEGDTKVLFYQAERKALPDGQAARSNYFHPLYDLDGNVLTEDFPKDHIHHRGIFWAWHQVLINGKRRAGSMDEQRVVLAGARCAD